MYLINITLNTDKVPTDKADVMFERHREWFGKNFKEGKFLLLGPYQDKEHAGIIIAQAPNRTALDEILASDVYYPDLAQYEVREFKAAMATDLSAFAQK
ncbi:YciI family protein [Campylobacter curvus]|uniref:YciI family protein n=1 Tax=Campylobacter curvus TaxID=200 RepID=UPI00146FF234|nr:YciI family protein [Campylobacter curvus]